MDEFDEHRFQFPSLCLYLSLLGLSVHLPLACLACLVDLAAPAQRVPAPAGWMDGWMDGWRTDHPYPIGFLKPELEPSLFLTWHVMLSGLVWSGVWCGLPDPMRLGWSGFGMGVTPFCWLAITEESMIIMIMTCRGPTT